jgi:hypothetical protein
MSTEAQIKANRQNAQKSTGPKTDEGKAAVSQNAVKHGLFTDSVVTGETEAEYAAFHGELLAELDPRGVMELLLAERVVSLWWRLRRAERMQNEVIEDMIEDQVTNPYAVRRRRDHCYNEGLEPGDPRFEPEHLALGRIASSDWSCTRVLDRMLIYERRIESSLNRAMKELKRFQTIRRIEWQEAVKQNNKSFYKDPYLAEAATRFSSGENQGDLKKQSQYDRSAFSVLRKESQGQRAVTDDLKKQSQFAMDDNGASLYAEEVYDDDPTDEAGENKANLSLRERACPEPVERGQFQAPRPTSRAGAFLNH